MRLPVKDAVIKDFLAFTCARVSVCLEHRVCPQTGRIHLFLQGEGGRVQKSTIGLIETRSPGPGSRKFTLKCSTNGEAVKDFIQQGSDAEICQSTNRKCSKLNP